MCVILDANMFGEFKDQDNEDMQPVWNWLEKKNGKIATPIQRNLTKNGNEGA